MCGYKSGLSQRGTVQIKSEQHVKGVITMPNQKPPRFSIIIENGTDVIELSGITERVDVSDNGIMYDMRGTTAEGAVVKVIAITAATRDS